MPGATAIDSGSSDSCRRHRTAPSRGRWSALTPRWTRFRWSSSRPSRSSARRVFRSPNPNGSPSIEGDPPAACTIVAAPDNSVRELCGTYGTSTFLAGGADVAARRHHQCRCRRGDGRVSRSGDHARPQRVSRPDGRGVARPLPQHGVTDSLLCRGDVAALRVAPTIVDPRFFETAWDVLQRSDGAWSVAASEVDYTCTGGNDAGIAGEICSVPGPSTSPRCRRSRP